jgi:hypothetical protein
MAEILSPSPYAEFSDLPTVERLAAIRLREHRANACGGSVIETARRARDLQAENARLRDYNLELQSLVGTEQICFDHATKNRDACRAMCAELVDALMEVQDKLWVMRCKLLEGGQ